MYYLINLKNKNVEFVSEEIRKLGDQWDKHPENYKWINGSGKLVVPKFDGEKIVEGKSIEEFKNDAYVAIDLKTERFIAQGIKYEDNIFSSSQNAQLSCHSMILAYQFNMVPENGIAWNVLNDKISVVIKKEEIVKFCTAIIGSVATIKDEGTAEKEKIRNMTSIQDIKNYVDNRTNPNFPLPPKP
jgi:hypothetical protein